MNDDLRKSVKCLVKDFIHQYLDARDAVDDVLAEYAIQTWLPPGESVKYLHIKGRPGTGKTRAGLVMEAICWKSTWLKGCESPFGYMKAMQTSQIDHPSTLIFDDIDFSNDFNYAPTLYAGSTRHERLIRMQENSDDSGFAPVVFNVFGPKIILWDGEFLSPSLRTKCIVVRLCGLSRMDIPQVLIDSDFRARRQAIRMVLYEFAFLQTKGMVHYELPQ